MPYGNWQIVKKKKHFKIDFSCNVKYIDIRIIDAMDLCSIKSLYALALNNNKKNPYFIFLFTFRIIVQKYYSRYVVPVMY